MQFPLLFIGVCEYLLSFSEVGGWKSQLLPSATEQPPMLFSLGLENANNCGYELKTDKNYIKEIT